MVVAAVSLYETEERHGDTIRSTEQVYSTPDALQKAIDWVRSGVRRANNTNTHIAFVRTNAESLAEVQKVMNSLTFQLYPTKDRSGKVQPDSYVLGNMKRELAPLAEVSLSLK